MDVIVFLYYKNLLSNTATYFPPFLCTIRMPYNATYLLIYDDMFIASNRLKSFFSKYVKDEGSWTSQEDSRD